MSGGMAMFQSELRSAVRDARETPMQAAAPQPQVDPRVSILPPRPVRGPSRPGRAVAEKRTVVRLWLPLTPLWIILAPLVLLLAPLLLLAPRLLPNRPRARAMRGWLAVRPYRTVWSLGAVLIALSGTLVDVDTPDALVRIRIF